MTAGVANLYIEQYAGYEATFTYLESDGVTPVDVTDWSASMTFRTTAGQEMLTVGSGTGEISITGGSGLFSLAIEGSQTAMLVESGLYDLLVTPSGGQPIRLIQGQVVVSLGQTV